MPVKFELEKASGDGSVLLQRLVAAQKSLG